MIRLYLEAGRMRAGLTAIKDTGDVFKKRGKTFGIICNGRDAECGGESHNGILETESFRRRAFEDTAFLHAGRIVLRKNDFW